MKQLKQIKLSVFLLLPFLISSCWLEEQADKGIDPEIVVIGNGAEGSVDWSQTLVVDMKGANGAIQSHVAGQKNVVPVLDRISDAARGDVKDLLEKRKDELTRVGWISSLAVTQVPIIKLELNEENSDSTCSVIEMKKDVACRDDLEKFEISNSTKPAHSADGKFAFVNAENELFIKANDQDPVSIEKNVGNYFFGRHGDLFYQKADQTWLWISPEKDMPVIFTSKDIVYRTQSGRVMVLVLEAGVRLGQHLVAHQLYEFYAKRGIFMAQWEKPNESIVYSQALLTAPRAVVGERLVLGAQRSDSLFLTKARSLAIIDCDGIETRNLYSEISQSNFDLIAGPTNVFVRPKYSEHPQIVGQLCSVSGPEQKDMRMPQKEVRHDVTCKLLMLPESQRALAATLGGDEVVVAVAKVQDLPSSKPVIDQADVAAVKEFPYRLAVLDSDFSSKTFGFTRKTWQLESEVQSLRFFDIARATEAAL